MSRMIVEKLLVFMMAFAISCFAVSKPMESVENYNVLMVHGAYGWNEGFIWPHMPSDYWKYQYGLEDVPIASLFSDASVLADVVKKLDEELPSAYDDTVYLGKANLGRYDSEDRLTYWLNKNIFEDDTSRKPQDSYIYHWRSFSNPANSSSNNARELGDRKWNQGNKNYGKGGFGHRRSLTEEAQKVKAHKLKIDNNEYTGQISLEIMRQNPDLYRQIPSRYILVGHSMGGVVSREYVQGNFYNDDIDKIITLDSPHEGSGALNMQIKNEARGDLIYDQMASTLATAFTTMELTAVPLLLSFKVANLARRWR